MLFLKKINKTNFSKKFLTAVLTPKLRVDNEIRIYGYDSQLINRCSFKETELYEVYWYED